MSSSTGYKYFNRVFLDLPARNASFTFTKWFRNADLFPTLADQFYTYVNISEAYGEGMAEWNGKEVRFHGLEQLLRLRRVYCRLDLYYFVIQTGHKGCSNPELVHTLQELP
jgi:hypothetical protein